MKLRKNDIVMLKNGTKSHRAEIISINDGVIRANVLSENVIVKFSAKNASKYITKILNEKVEEDVNTKPLIKEILQETTSFPTMATVSPIVPLQTLGIFGIKVNEDENISKYTDFTRLMEHITRAQRLAEKNNMVNVSNVLSELATKLAKKFK